MAKSKGKPTADHYLYSVGWSEEDHAYIARVAEFQSLAAHGSTQQQALKQIKEVVATVLEDLGSAGESIPAPLGEARFSGRLNLRMPEFLHRQLAIEAAHEGISLNQLINLKLESAAKSG
jgi:predicted HicB family RNase H-like nuclease